MSEFCFEMLGIMKRFPNVLALDNVNFQVKKGEIHALLGENGAGKTTLMKILCGLYKQDLGKIIVQGKEVKINSPKDAINQGICMVHQKFLLVESLTVLENIALGTKMNTFFPTKNIESKIKNLVSKYALDVDLDAKIWQISASEQQKVEILKALYRGARILILDEPTSMIAPSEYEGLFKSLKELTKSGTSIVFISHKLKEAIGISDEITIMRKGKIITTVKANEMNLNNLANMMIESDSFSHNFDKKNIITEKEPIINIVKLFVENDRGFVAVKDVSFSLNKGEILGVAGVSGSGQNELMETIVGLRRPKSGRIEMDSKDLTKLTIKQIIDLGIAYIPESRKISISPEMSVAENSVLKTYSTNMFKGLLMKEDIINEYAKQLVDKFNVVTPTLNTPMKFLSGGNIQKIIIGRELISNPKIIIAGNPTSGLDLSATKLTHKMLEEARDNGSAVILFSEEIDEILELSNRVAVMFNGSMTKIFEKVPPLSELSLAMTGA